MTTTKLLASALIAIMACACNMNEPEINCQSMPKAPAAVNEVAMPQQAPLTFNMTPSMVGPETYVPVDLSIQRPRRLEATPIGISYVDMLEWIAEGAAKAAGGKSVEYLYEQFFQSPESKQMDDLYDLTTQVNGKLDELIQRIKMDNYREYMNQRLTKVTELYNYSVDYVNELQVTDPTDTARIALLAQNWGTKGSIGGNAPEAQVKNFIDWLIKVDVEEDHATLYDAYDAYVFNSVPWESMGYDVREALRAGDMSVIAINAELAILYIQTSPIFSQSTKDKALQQISDHINAYKAYADAHPVVRHSDAICQIPNAHVVMPAALYVRDYANQTWFAKRTHYSSSAATDIVYGSSSMTKSQFISALLTTKEADAIVNYYTSKGETNLFRALERDAHFVTYNKTVYEPADFLLVGSEASVSRNGNEYTLNAPALPLGGTIRRNNCKVGIALFEAGGVGQYLYFDGWKNGGDQTVFHTLVTQRF